MFLRTVKGDLGPDQIGFTHYHDHLFVFKTKGTRFPDKLLLDNYARTKLEVLRFLERGGNCIVDAQPFGAGRNVSLLDRLSRETGVHIIATTGLHLSDFYSPGFWSYDASLSEIADLFVSEIEEGMYIHDYADPFTARSDIKAGVIKVATGRDGLDDYCRKVFEAAIVAHLKTGAPILTHTENSRFGMEQAKYLIKGGVSPECIIIGHVDRIIDTPSNRELAGLGVFLGYDTIARYHYHSDEEEISLLRAMIKAGFCRQILLGMDSTRERFISYGGNLGLDFILYHFIPIAVRRGVRREDLVTITEENPKKAFSFRKKQSI